MLRMDVDESRRLTGPNLLSDNPGAVMEVFIEGIMQGSRNDDSIADQNYRTILWLYISFDVRQHKDADRCR